MEEDPSTSLVTVEGETIFTVQDLSYLMIEQEVSHEVKGTSLKTEKEVFERGGGTAHLGLYRGKAGRCGGSQLLGGGIRFPYGRDPGYGYLC